MADSTIDGAGWKRFGVVVPIITALIGAVAGWCGNTLTLERQERASAEERLVRMKELEQKQLEHEVDSRLQRYETASKFLPYLKDENPEVRSVALKAVEELGIQPVAKQQLQTKSVAELFRPRSADTLGDTAKSAQKLAQDSLLPAENLGLALRETISPSDTPSVRTDSTSVRRRAYGLWRDVNGNYWVGGPCVAGQVCADLTPGP